MIAINIGQDKSVVKKFLNEKASVDFTVLLDEKKWNSLTGMFRQYPQHF